MHQKRGNTRYLWVMVGAYLAYLGYQQFQLLFQGESIHPVIGTVSGIVFIAVGGLVLWREWDAWRWYQAHKDDPDPDPDLDPDLDPDPDALPDASDEDDDPSDDDDWSDDDPSEYEDDEDAPSGDDDPADGASDPDGDPVPGEDGAPKEGTP